MFLKQIVEAKKIISYAGNLEDLEPGYQGKEFTNHYGNAPQRWLLIFSQQAYLREEKTLKTTISKEKQEKSKELHQLASKEFDCEKDAKEAVLRWSKKLEIHKLSEIEIQSQKNMKEKEDLKQRLLSLISTVFVQHF